MTDPERGVRVARLVWAGSVGALGLVRLVLAWSQYHWFHATLHSNVEYSAWRLGAVLVPVELVVAAIGVVATVPLLSLGRGTRRRRILAGALVVVAAVLAAWPAGDGGPPVSLLTGYFFRGLGLVAVGGGMAVLALRGRNRST